MIAQVFNFVYGSLLLGLSPVLLYRRIRFGKYRRGFRQRLFGQLPEPAAANRPRVWLHAVSVGEVLQLRSLIDQLRQVRPDIHVLITTTTETGFQVASEKFPDCQIAFFPLDFSWSMRNAIQRARPDLIVLVELELWPNLLLTARRQQIPVALMNGRLSQKSFSGYSKIRPIIKRLLECLATVLVQTDEYRTRFLALGCPSEVLTVTGSIKFDGAQLESEPARVEDLRKVFSIEPKQPVWVAGSTHEPEERLIIGVYLELLKTIPDLRLILVPRHPERRDAIAQIVKEAGLGLIQRSQDIVSHLPLQPPIVGLLDTVGELSDCWGLANVAFVGGSFSKRGGQNMIEPAALGVPTCFGPGTQNFRDVVQLLASSPAIRTVHTTEELREFVEKAILEVDELGSARQHLRNLVRSQQGATQKTCELLLKFLPGHHEIQSRAA